MTLRLALLGTEVVIECESAEASARLENIPECARPMAKTGIEKFATERGLAQIDAHVLEQAREFFGM